LKFGTILNNHIERHYPVWRQIARRITRDNVRADDLLHTVIESIMGNDTCRQLPPEELNAYVIRCMEISFMSPRSRYHYLYRKPAELIDLVEYDLPEPDQPDLDQRAQNETADSMLSKLPELDAMLMRMYVMPGFSYDHLSLATGIPKPYIYQRIKVSIRKLKLHAENQGQSRNSG
jgi:RNA polymerase sigma factor (sigma-70 family)